MGASRPGPSPATATARSSARLGERPDADEAGRHRTGRSPNRHHTILDMLMRCEQRGQLLRVVRGQEAQARSLGLRVRRTELHALLRQLRREAPLETRGQVKAGGALNPFPRKRRGRVS